MRKKHRWWQSFLRLFRRTPDRHRNYVRPRGLILRGEGPTEDARDVYAAYRADPEHWLNKRP